MASNDYYNNQFHHHHQNPPYSHQDTSYSRTNQPLPPIPSSPSGRTPNPYINTSNISPVVSPFDDHTYPAYPRPSQSYSHMPDYGDPNGRYEPHDPFRDSNAIPLQAQQSLKAGGRVSSSPTSGMGDAEHQYGSRHDKTSRRSSRHQSKPKQGWFKGKITWAVYFLTCVQLIIFIVELVRNGERMAPPTGAKVLN
jgi:hypothetical protein